MARNRFHARRQWLSAVPQLIVTLALAAIALAALSGSATRDGGARERLFDLFQRLAPASETAADRFHLIEIDADSIAKIGPWPWPRSIVADLVDRARTAGADAVVYAEPVDVPDPLSPETIGAFWLSGARDGALRAELALLPSTDASLAAALAPTRGVVAIRESVETRLSDDTPRARADFGKVDWADAAAASNGGGDFVGLPTTSMRFAVDAALASEATIAVASLPPDRDGVLRAAPLVWSVDGAPRAAVSLEAARAALGAERALVETTATSVSADGRVPKRVSLGDRSAPVDAGARMRLYLPQRPDIAATPAWRTLDDAGATAQFSGKVVLIGRAADVGGVVRTARGDFSPTEAHALLAAQIAAGATSYRPAWAGYLEAVLVMALGAAAIMWSQKLDFWRAFALSSLAAALVFAAAAVAFNASRLLIDPFPASLALFLGALTVAGGRSIGAVLTDDTVRGSFRGALPEPTMKKLREEGDARSLDAARREITVLACEVRLLDEDVERLAREPGVATDLIAAASEQIRKTLVECGGAVDQANGGKIFAYFNAPLEAADHARAACSAALRLVEGMDAINLKLEGATQTRGAQTHLAIGVASGVCVAGPMGHGRGNRYSAIGRAVELAAFLRRQAEYYGPAIICSEAVHREANPHFAFLELDRVAPRGGDKPFGVHALVGNPFIKSSKSFRQLDEAHRAMLAAYRDGAYLEARAHLNKARQHPGAGIALFDIYAARIDAALDGHDPDDPTDDDAPTGGRHETVTI